MSDMNVVIAVVLWAITFPLSRWGERQERDGKWLLLAVAVWFTGLGFFLSWLVGR